MTNRSFFAALLITLLTACEPMGPIPGGELRGSVVATPADWSELGDIKTIQLETTPGQKPYSVNLWGISIAPFYYIASADGGDTKWAKRIEKDENVRLRIDNQIFELRAKVVTDPKEWQQIAEAYQKKYDIERSDDLPKARIYRLERRE